MKQSDDNRFIPMTSFDAGEVREVAPDVAYYTNQIVNVVMIGLPDSDWVLVDAGMPDSGKKILEKAEERFGEKPPQCIILTHGHFDHVGGIVELLHEWKVPVYAHPDEFVYLTGQKPYPEPDTTVEGGLLAKISSIYPHEATDIHEALRTLSSENVPFLREWEWIHVPGHSPGQIALFREKDRLLFSADAVITVKQDSLYRVLIQKKEVCGPPVYLTTDWDAAYQSALKLASLHPQILIPGHGNAMQGKALEKGLDLLIKEWDKKALPEYGKWVERDEMEKT